MTDPTPDPQPVRNAASIQAWLLRTIGAVAVLTGWFGWWSPDGETILVIAGFGAAMYGSVLEAVGWFVHKKVTPNEKVALTVAEKNLLEVANDPQTPIGMGLLRDAAQIQRDRIPPPPTA